MSMGKAVKSAFWIALTQELMRGLPNWYDADNWDAERFGAQRSSLKSRLVNRLNKAFNGRIAIIPGNIEQQAQAVASLQGHLEGLSALYDLLGDEASKSTLIKVIAYRLMGYRKIKLPRNSVPGAYESNRRLVRSLLKRKDVLPINFNDWSLSHFELHKLGYPIECYSVSSGILPNFIFKQYEYGKNNPEIKAQPGDCVIDAGGGWGDTALYFAHTVGSQGKVYTFEFTPDNLEVLHRNISLNPQLADRIQVVSLALWNRSGESIGYSVHGPATSLKRASDQKHLRQTSTTTIDDFVKQEGLNRVGFIKMDIEGSELNALQGAEQTLCTFRPRLAIALYHSLDDFVRVPNYLNELNLSYQFFLDHFTIHREETILFADPRTG